MIGDFTARVGHLPDFYTLNNYLMHVYNSKDSFLTDIATRSPIFDECNVALEKTAQDHTVNNYGYKLIKTIICI